MVLVVLTLVSKMYEKWCKKLYYELTNTIDRGTDGGLYDGLYSCI